MIGNKEYAKEFDKILEKYTENERIKLWQILLNLSELYQKQQEPKDILGEMYSKIGIYNKQAGQFFTPTHISDLMTEIVGIDEEEIKNRGYVTLNEPCVGAGGMVLSYAKALQKKGYNPHENLFVEVCDIDMLCTYMTYVQLSMYDIPAVVINGDTLTLKQNIVLYTPQYYRGFWEFRKMFENLRNDKQNTMEKAIKEEGQLNFWDN